MDNIVVYFYDGFCGKNSHELLKSSASLFSCAPVDDLSLEYISGRKPRFISHPNVHFSISHSENIWICAFSDSEVGADIQIISKERPWDELARRFFCENEYASVRHSSNTAAEFCRIWCRKEAAVKLMGNGIDSTFSQFDSTHGHTLACGRDIIIKSLSFDIPALHSAAVASYSDFQITVVDMKKAMLK